MILVCTVEFTAFGIILSIIHRCPVDGGVTE